MNFTTVDNHLVEANATMENGGWISSSRGQQADRRMDAYGRLRPPDVVAFAYGQNQNKWETSAMATDSDVFGPISELDRILSGQRRRNDYRIQQSMVTGTIESRH